MRDDDGTLARTLQVRSHLLQNQGASTAGEILHGSDSGLEVLVGTEHRRSLRVHTLLVVVLPRGFPDLLVFAFNLAMKESAVASRNGGAAASMDR